MMKVPDAARSPFYSFWYSQHQSVDAKSVEEECRRAAKLGFSSVIVDDGWQTDDNNRGYAFCGDWEPAADKFPDFLQHVKCSEYGPQISYVVFCSVCWEKSEGMETV